MSSLTPRERVYVAANLKEPDRVPICFGGATATSIIESSPNGQIASELYKYLGVNDTEPIRISDVFGQPVNLDERLLQRLHSDMRRVDPNPPPPIIHSDGTKTWPWFCGARIKRLGYYDDFFDFPMRHMTTKNDIDNYPYWPDTSVDIMEGVADKAKYLHEETDYFIVGRSLSAMMPFNAYGQVFCGLDKWLSDMKLRPRFYHQLAEKLLEIGLAINNQFFSGIGQYLDGANIYDDLGTQEGPLMSLSDYREFYKPYTAEIIKNVRKYLRPEAKIILHSCGSVYEFIPDLIEIGVDILNPVQPLARYMEPWRLKKEFGAKLAFFGGLDIQQLLPLGTPEQIREGVKILIQEYAQGGGFIFAASHTIEPDTAPENIVAMFDAAYEYGKYPIADQTGRNYIEYISSLKLH